MKRPVTIASAVLAQPIAELAPPPGGGGLTVYDSATGTPTAIAVPTGPEPPALAVRCHEYGHLLLRDIQTPLARVTDIADPIKQAVMDVQTNAWLIRKGVPAVSHLPLRGPGRVRDGHVNLLDRILIAYRSYGLADPPPVRLPRPLRKRVKQAQRMAARATDADSLLKACVTLQSILEQPEETPVHVPGHGRGPERGPAPPPPPEGETDPDEPGGDSDSDDEGDGDGDGDIGHDCPPKPSPRLIHTLGRIAARDKAEATVRGKETMVIEQFPLEDKELDHASPKFMTMQISRPELERRLRQSRDYGRSARPTYASGSMRYPLRALPGVGDGRVFAGIAPGTHGSLLIDFSGSMDLDAKDIERILAVCPRMLVATYCGDKRKNHGELRVLAHHGRIAAPADIQRYGNANGVDGPALQWLARQSSPRIWVCDGDVTGLGDTPSSVLRARCDAIVKAHAIRQYCSLKAFLASRKGGG